MHPEKMSGFMEVKGFHPSIGAVEWDTLTVWDGREMVSTRIPLPGYKRQSRMKGP
jgi:hypothetical protein